MNDPPGTVADFSVAFGLAALVLEAFKTRRRLRALEKNSHAPVDIRQVVRQEQNATKIAERFEQDLRQAGSRQ